MSTATTDLPTGMTMTDDFYLEHESLARSIALREHQRSTIYDVDDLQQAIWEHVVKNWGHYAEADEKLVGFYMTRAARTYANNQRVDYMYFTGAFVYTPKVVAAYLEECAWEPLDAVPDVDARVDMIEAFQLLKSSAPEQAAAVYRRYALKEFDEMTESEQKNSRRGVDSITHRLNTGLRLNAESIELTSKEN